MLVFVRKLNYIKLTLLLFSAQISASNIGVLKAETALFKEPTYVCMNDFNEGDEDDLLEWKGRLTAPFFKLSSVFLSNFRKFVSEVGK